MVIRQRMTENDFYFTQYVDYYCLCYSYVSEVRLGVIDSATPPLNFRIQNAPKKFGAGFVDSCCSSRVNQSDKHSPACN